ncbi:MAG: FAD-dependent monooxygenase [Firmicutes bacterium]|nr:FAD-dependent monooxygenase [Bacillota bacterium]
MPDGGLGYLKERLTAFFPNLEAAIAGIRDLREVQVIPSYYLLAERWVADGAALLGDAIHCVNPARGQGMNLAIADAWELAEVLAGALAAGRTDARALAAYAARRRRHVEYIQKEGDRTRRFLLATHPLMARLRDRVFRNMPRAPRAIRRLTAVLAGVEPPPSPAEDLLLLAAFTFPWVDRLVPAGGRTTVSPPGTGTPG